MAALMEASDDADPTADAAADPPSGRARRTLARPLQFLGAERRGCPPVLFELWPRPARGGRPAEPLHPRPSASLGLDHRGAAQEAAIHLVRRVRGRPAALPRAARRAADRAHRSAARDAIERTLVPPSRRHADRNSRG